MVLHSEEEKDEEQLFLYFTVVVHFMYFESTVGYRAIIINEYVSKL